MKSHLSAKRGIIAKHTEEYHAHTDKPHFIMKPINHPKTILQRLVLEGNLILEADKSKPGSLMNGKSEWGRGKMVRFTPVVSRY